jgi:CRISPR/Cas system-associated exonuclease Cas4 (RecB family)
MELSDKQEALVDYLLTRLGFRKGQVLDEYLRTLATVAHIHRNVRAIWPDQSNENFEEPDFYWWDGEKYLPEKYDIVDFLIDEYKLKNEKNYEINRDIPNHISATDLADFTFCPIGFSLRKSFDTTTLTTSETGTRLHEQCRLIKRIDLKREVHREHETKTKEEDKITAYINRENRAFFEEIKDSKLIYSGHSNNQTKEKYFINEELNFIGQPDYVFKNARGDVFIVEEKFKRERYRGFDTFFRNHKVQLASYIYYLKQFKVKHGYLVYWMYDYIDNKICYDRCLVKKLTKSDNAETFLNNAFDCVKKFKEEKYYNIEDGLLKPKKCASCVYCMYCGHKNGRKDQVTLPYQRGYHNLFRAEYPDILKQDDQDENE